jgi:hypothetical protein
MSTILGEVGLLMGQRLARQKIGSKPQRVAAPP